MVKNHLIRILPKTDDLLNECKEEFLKHHPEFEQMTISYNKIVYEMAKFYLSG